MLPTCSVVIATRDRPAQLRRCVASVLGQSLRPKELIVIDDCSQHCVDAAIGNSDCGGVHFRCERLSLPSGAPVARNMGAKLASGDVLMFLDDDDVWEAKKIETQLRLFSAHPEVGVVYTGMLAIDDISGNVLSVSTRHHSGHGWPNILFRNFMGPTSAVAVRTPLFHAVGGFDPDLPALQDYDLWLRLCMATPILYDGGHNLRFCGVSNAGSRISADVAVYETAFRHLHRKYQSKLARLPAQQQRQFSAQSKLILASKNLAHSRYANAATLMLQAIALHPATLVRLLLALASRIPIRVSKARD